MTRKQIDPEPLDQKRLRDIAWLLDRENAISPDSNPHTPSYGDVTALNTARLILDSVGTETLQSMAEDVMMLLDTSLAVYERNGDYAFGMFVSDWCSIMDEASRKLCGTDDNREALRCGKWLCHENCWNDSAKAAMKKGEPTDIACVGGSRLYCVPIKIGKEIVGAVNMGYSQPPQDRDTLEKLAKTFQVDTAALEDASMRFKPRPPFIVEAAKIRLHTMAGMIAEIIIRRQNEELLRNVLDADPNCIFLKNAEGQYVLVNKTMANVHATTPREMTGKTDTDFLPESVTKPEEAKHFLEDDRKVLETGKPLFIPDEAFSNPDGTVSHFQTTKIPVHIPIHGQCLLGVATDVTHNRRATEELRRSQALLEATGRMARVGGWEVDVKTKEVTWTRETYRIHEVPTDQKPPLDEAINFFHPDDREKLSSAIERAMTTGEPYDLELRFKSARGKELLTHTIGIPVMENGEIVRLTGTFQDITEQKQLQQRLLQMEKMDAIGQLAGGVAHDFNNQLAGIMGYADLLLNRLKDPDLKRYAENILVGSRRAADLTRQLLAFARKGQYQTIPVSIHETIAEVVAILTHSIDKRIRISQLLKANPPTTIGDPTQLQSMLLNLALNARDAMPEGGELTFETDIAELDSEYCDSLPYEIKPGTFLSVCVTDTGCGMDKNTQNRVFEPFFTTKEPGQGTGMGLAAVYGAVKQHGGAINIYSEPEHGTTFRIYLPSHGKAPNSRKKPSPSSSYDLSGTALVVDDEKIFRDMATDMLKQTGLEVVTMKNGKEAVEYYRKHFQDIDIVILDMIMPELNGRDTYRVMKDINPEVVVLLASGYSINGDAQDLMSEGVRGFLQKPFQQTELMRNISEALDSDDDNQP